MTGPSGEETQEDLGEVIGVMKEMAAAGEPDPELACTLGQALAERYSGHGDEGDRDEAITWLRQACDAPVPARHDPDDDLQLAMLLIDRGESTATWPTLKPGWSTRRAPGEDLPPLVPYVLGVGHLVRAELGPTPASFPVAVGYLREAAARLPEGSPNGPT